MKFMYMFESVFDVLYLVLVILMGFYILRKSRGYSQFRLFGWMAVILGFGDAFHLLPRIFSMWSEGGFDAHIVSLGFGKMVTSVTMTIFYVMLYFVWKKRYDVLDSYMITVGVLLLAVLRIVLCFMPQNQWFSSESPYIWGIFRNIPFFLMGMWIMLLFQREARQHRDRGFINMWLAILISFACYLPVVLLADILPPVGAFMLPKTVAYLWMVWMGFREAVRL